MNLPAHVICPFGKPDQVTIWFVLDDEEFYIGTANVCCQWVRNVQKTPQIKLFIGGETFEDTARFLTAMTAIRRKYWMFRPLIALGRVLTAMGLMHDNAGSFEVTLARSKSHSVLSLNLALGHDRVFLTLLRGGGRGQQILAFGQAPNGESNDVNHTEPELFLEAVNDMQV